MIIESKYFEPIDQAISDLNAAIDDIAQGDNQTAKEFVRMARERLQRIEDMFAE